MSDPLPSELDIQDVLRRRAAEMHQQVDTWLELTLRELGIQDQGEPEHSIGISFEPGVALAVLPSESDLLKVGFYTPNADRQVEVVPGTTQGMISFEITHPDGQVQSAMIDEELFAFLFVSSKRWKQSRLKLPRPSSSVSYSVHPFQRDLAVRYNANGTVSTGRFGDQGEFIEE